MNTTILCSDTTIGKYKNGVDIVKRDKVLPWLKLISALLTGFVV